MEESSSSPSSSGTSGGGRPTTRAPPPADRSPSSPKGAYNPRHPSVKRILREGRELAQNADLAIFAASPLEDNLFEWLFAVSGPPGTEFAGGVYLGRILLPPEYPMRPPAFAFLTPNGRFETGVRVCLSISQHHPEEWQPSWGVRTALTALQAFLPTPGRGAVGSLDLKPEERRKLAARSRDPGGVAELLGSAKEDKLSLAAELHRLVLEHASEAVVSSPGGRGGGGGGEGAEAEAEAAPENRSPPERSPPTGSPAPARNPPSAGDLAGPPAAAAPVLPLPDVLLRVAAAGVFLAILRVLARRAGAPGAEL